MTPARESAGFPSRASFTNWIACPLPVAPSESEASTTKTVATLPASRSNPISRNAPSNARTTRTLSATESFHWRGRTPVRRRASKNSATTTESAAVTSQGRSDSRILGGGPARLYGSELGREAGYRREDRFRGSRINSHEQFGTVGDLHTPQPGTFDDKPRHSRCQLYSGASRVDDFSTKPRGDIQDIPDLDGCGKEALHPSVLKADDPQEGGTPTVKGSSSRSAGTSDRRTGHRRLCP